MSKFYKHFFILFLAVFSLGQLQRIQLSQSLAVYIHDIVIMVWLSVSAVTHQAEWKKLFATIQRIVLKHTALRWLLIIIVLNLAIHTVLGHLPLTSYLHIDRILLYITFALSLPFTVPFPRSTQRWLWSMVGVMIAWLGIVQYFFLPDTRFLRYLGWDDHYFRLISTLLDPNFTGIALAVSLFYVWSLKTLPRPLKLICSALLGTAQLLTLSRATYLAIILSVGLLLWWKLRTRALNILGGLLIASIIAVWLIPKPTGEGVNLLRVQSIQQRMLSNQLVVMKMKPYEWVVGRGLFLPLPRVFGSQLPQHARFPDNLIVFVATGLGIPGLVLAVVLVVAVTQWMYVHDMYLCAAWVAILVHSQFNHTLFEPFIFLLLLGGVTSMKKQKPKVVMPKVKSGT